MKNKDLKHNVSESRIEITFCKPNSCCPSIVVDKHDDTVVIGGKDEGYTKFTKEQFQMLLAEAKYGTFDEFI